MAELIISVTRGHRHQESLYKVDKFPFAIGRAYDNDLILNDDTVSPHHLRLLRHDDELQIQNLSNENGTWIGDRQLDGEPEALAAGETISAGRTHLRFLLPDTPLEPTRPYSRLPSLHGKLTSLTSALVLLLVFFLISIYQAYERMSLSSEWTEILVSQLTVVLSPLLIAAITGFISRLLLHHWRYSLQLTIACSGLLLNEFLQEFTGFTNYFFTSQSMANTVEFFLQGIMLSFLFTWLLTAVSNVSIKTAAFSSIAIVWVLLGIFRLQSYVNQPDFRAQPQMHTVIQSHDLRLMSDDDSVPDFIRNVQAELRQGMDEELQEAGDNS